MPDTAPPTVHSPTDHTSLPSRPRRPRPERFAQFIIRGVIADVAPPRNTRKGTASTMLLVELDNKRQLPLLLLDHDLAALQQRIEQHGLIAGATIRAQGTLIPALNRTETDRFIIDRDELIVIHAPSSPPQNGS